MRKKSGHYNRNLPKLIDQSEM